MDKTHTIKIVNPLEYPGWDKSLLSVGEYSFYHSTAWAMVLMKSYGYIPRYVVIYLEGRPVGLIPFMEIRSIFTGKRGVSLPFSDYCVPIIPNGFFLNGVFNWIAAHARQEGWKYLEIRGGTAFSESIIVSRSYYVHTLRLSQNENDMLKSFRDSTKRNIKRAVKEKVTVKKDNSPEAMKAFYRLNCMTRKKHGLPPQPETFFNRILYYVISRNKGHIFLAYYRNRNIAGAIYFHMGQKVIYKYGASDPKYLNVRANNLVMWESIKCYSRIGYTHFCLGRTEPGNKGLLQYKSGWGAKQDMIHYYRYDLVNNKFVTSNANEVGLHTKIFKHMPVGLLRFIGRQAYKHVG